VVPFVVIYPVLGLAGCGLTLVGWLFGRRSGLRQMPGKDLVRAAIEKPSPRSRSPAPKRASTGSVPRVGPPTGQLAALERHLRTAIFDQGARERLIADALGHTRGDRVAAIRKVLSDLESEDRRWS